MPQLQQTFPLQRTEEMLEMLEGVLNVLPNA
jgi:hypothetical protein